MHKQLKVQKVLIIGLRTTQITRLIGIPLYTTQLCIRIQLEKDKKEEK
jgi:hypothetical protein